MNTMGKATDFLSTSYENLSLVGDFNAEKSNKSKKDFCDAYVFKYLIKQSTRYKNPNNPKCIDLMLTNIEVFKILVQLKQDYLIFTK